MFPLVPLPRPRASSCRSARRASERRRGFVRTRRRADSCSRKWKERGRDERVCIDEQGLCIHSHMRTYNSYIHSYMRVCVCENIKSEREGDRWREDKKQRDNNIQTGSCEIFGENYVPSLCPEKTMAETPLRWTRRSLGLQTECPKEHRIKPFPFRICHWRPLKSNWMQYAS